MELERVFSAVWGTDVQRDVFNRWKQGFRFSREEPLALVQNSGGPCAVLAPVQAFIIQKRLFEDFHCDNLETKDWRSCAVQELLLRALTHILKQASNDGHCKVATLNSKETRTADIVVGGHVQLADSKHSPDHTGRGRSKYAHPSGSPSSGQKRKYTSLIEGDTDDEGEDEEEGRFAVKGLKSGEILPPAVMASLLRRAAEERTPQHSSKKITAEQLSLALSNVLGGGAGRGGVMPHPQAPKVLPVGNVKRKATEKNLPEKMELSGSQPFRSPAQQRSHDTTAELHLNIKVISLDNSAVMECLKENMADFVGPFGVLLFLYSVILTKGVGLLLEEREEAEQPLIDPVHGHGSQSLVNLLLVGRAVTNVFDSDRDLGGIKLKGIPYQSTIGFLTILEALRYCEVGSFLKSPVYPVWLVGSETHLTVLFSTERCLASPENAKMAARRAFQKFDVEGTGMIPTDKLGALLEELHLETDPNYLQYMSSKLDTESSGVILLSDFLQEFYAHQMDIDPPKAFTLYHYNGLPHPSGGKVVFACGSAVVLSEEGGTTCETTLINCLTTKWPGLLIHWEDCTSEPRIL